MVHLYSYSYRGRAEVMGTSLGSADYGSVTWISGIGCSDSGEWPGASDETLTKGQVLPGRKSNRTQQCLAVCEQTSAKWKPGGQPGALATGGVCCGCGPRLPQQCTSGGGVTSLRLSARLFPMWCLPRNKQMWATTRIGKLDNTPLHSTVKLPFSG